MTTKPLHELAVVLYGKSPNGVRSDHAPYPIWGTGGIIGNAQRPLFPGPVIILPRKGTLSNPSFCEIDCWVIDTAYAAIARNGVDIKWLYYNLSQKNLEALNEATGVPSISRDLLNRLEFYVPSYDEQHSISHILTTIDNLIDHTESLIAKYQSIKQGMMYDLFTRGVDANGRLRPPREEALELYKESALGWIPKEWEVVQLSDIANVNRGKFTARPRNDPMYYGGQYPFIQTGDVTNNFGRVITHFSQTLSEPGKSVSRSFPPGTIAVTIAANIADTSILGIEMFFPDSIVGIEVNHEHSVRFIELCIRMNKPFLDAKAPQSAQKNINLNDLRPLLVPLPHPDEQHKISKIYETIECNSRILEENLTKFQIMKSGLMHDLLTGTVRIPPHLTPAQEPPHAV